MLSTSILSMGLLAAGVFADPVINFRPYPYIGCVYNYTIGGPDESVSQDLTTESGCFTPPYAFVSSFTTPSTDYNETASPCYLNQYSEADCQGDVIQLEVAGYTVCNTAGGDSGVSVELTCSS